MTQAIDQFTQEAVNLFNNKIHDLWKTSGNVWRNGCAMDTILDYFTVCKINPATYGDIAVNSLDPTKGGNWWDDFGWVGLAAIRAAEQDLWPQQYRDRFLKIAINSWAYMYGPGWSKTNTAIYPFTGADLPGWEKFETTHKTNRGAPNVWKDIDQTWTNKPISEADKMERQPRYSPGGIWNSPLENANQPELTLSYQGDGSYVNPIQNTVTNAVFTILSLRIYQAGKNGLFSNIFNESGLDVDSCLQAWKDQIGWFDQWILQTTAPDESMKLSLDTGCLIRERASTFHEWKGQQYWDGSYRKDWIWTGDQGLLIGALREGKAAGYMKSNLLDLYPQIVEGVFKYGYKPRTYNKTIKGNFLLPWIVVGSQNPYSEGALAGDANDYQTGTGIFMRYLLQAYKAEPSLLQNHKDTILNSANNIIKEGFGTNPDPRGSCDPFTPYTGEDAATLMTAYINRLSVLLLAIEMS
jgi:hypothetical protein